MAATLLLCLPAVVPITEIRTVPPGGPGTKTGQVTCSIDAYKGDFVEATVFCCPEHHHHGDDSSKYRDDSSSSSRDDSSSSTDDSSSSSDSESSSDGQDPDSRNGKHDWSDTDNSDTDTDTDSDSDRRPKKSYRGRKQAELSLAA